ncbi:MAG: hypothetical protein V4651_08765 [Bacteroidota bacterium]
MKLFLWLFILFNYAENLSAQNSDCARGAAEPIIKKSIYPKTTFKLQADSLTAVETVLFPNGDKLIIKNWGCTCYTLTFRFETSQFKRDTTNLKFWYITAYRLMTEASKGMDAPLDIKKGLERFNNYISGNVFELTLNKEIDFGGPEIRDIVTLERIQRISKDRYGIVISFSRGPL